MQCADVTKMLASVSKICDMGNENTFTKSGGIMRNLSTGKTTKVSRKGNLYVMDVWVKAKHEEDQLYQVEKDAAVMCQPCEDSRVSPFNWRAAWE